MLAFGASYILIVLDGLRLVTRLFATPEGYLGRLSRNYRPVTAFPKGAFSLYGRFGL